MDPQIESAIRSALESHDRDAYRDRTWSAVRAVQRVDRHLSSSQALDLIEQFRRKFGRDT